MSGMHGRDPHGAHGHHERQRLERRRDREALRRCKWTPPEFTGDPPEPPTLADVVYALCAGLLLLIVLTALAGAAMSFC